MVGDQKRKFNTDAANMVQSSQPVLLLMNTEVYILNHAVKTARTVITIMPAMNRPLKITSPSIGVDNAKEPICYVAMLRCPAMSQENTVKHQDAEVVIRGGHPSHHTLCAMD